MYRGREYMARERRLKNEKKGINWYNGRETREKFYIAPLIVDPTPSGQLKTEIEKICQEEGAGGGMCIKLVERGGEKLKSVCKSNPTGSKECKRQNCEICKGDKPGRCGTAGIGYRCICKECEGEGTKAYYEGESGDNAFNRQKQHEAAVKGKKVEKSAIAKHMKLQHGGIAGKFSMEVTGTFRSCVTRLADEGIRVREDEDDVDILMNSRMEFHQPPISRVVAMRGNSREDQEERQGGGRHDQTRRGDANRERRQRGNS
jgi:hypothetical protein